MMIIDSNILFGFDIHRSIDLGIERSLALMEEKNIHRGMVSNLRCKYDDFRIGNEETARLVEAHPGKLYGLGGFHLSRFLDLEHEIHRCINELGLSGFRIFNTNTGFIAEWGGGIDSYTMRMVLKILDGMDVPVFIEGGYPFITIGTLAGEFPRVPIIASGIGYGNMGEAILAAQRNPNISLEISALDTHDGIGVLVEYLTADRLVFGTGMPYNSPSCQLLMVGRADIPDGDKEKIFSGNLLGILNARRVKK
ncbi:MAG: amidohydrolase family protein [Clostridia bacterium]